MAFVPIANTGQLIIRYTDSVNTGVNVMHFTVPPGFSFSVADADVLRAQWSAARNVASGLRTRQTASTIFVGVSIRDIRTANQPLIDSATISEPGTSAGSGLPLENAICTTLRTSLAGRSFRGRIYHYGFTAADVGAGNIIAAAAVSAVAATMNSFLSAMGAISAPVVVASRKLAIATPVTSTFTNTAWDTQRRRGRP